MLSRAFNQGGVVDRTLEARTQVAGRGGLRPAPTRCVNPTGWEEVAARPSETNRETLSGPADSEVKSKILLTVGSGLKACKISRAQASQSHVEYRIMPDIKPQTSYVTQGTVRVDCNTSRFKITISPVACYGVKDNNKDYIVLFSESSNTDDPPKLVEKGETPFIAKNDDIKRILIEAAAHGIKVELGMNGEAGEYEITSVKIPARP